MPAFHISVNFDIQGPYFVTYPGAGQWYVALEEACVALDSGLIDIAMVGAVAHQRNFLVGHHFSRIPSPVPAERLVDSAGCLILETEEMAQRRSATVRGRMLDFDVSYQPNHPFEEILPHNETFEGCPPAKGELGPCSFPVSLALSNRGTIRHALQNRDGFCASSAWEIS
jgi:hypothetical protein